MDQSWSTSIEQNEIDSISPGSLRDAGADLRRTEMTANKIVISELQESTRKELVNMSAAASEEEARILLKGIIRNHPALVFDMLQEEFMKSRNHLNELKNILSDDRR